MNCQLKIKTCRLISCSTLVLLFFIAYSALASPPILYKPALHHHADGHYHFNRLIDDTLGPNDLKVLTVLFLPNDVTPGADASSRAITLAGDVQLFFRTQMAVKGYQTNSVGKTFDLVRDTDGNVVVVTINGADSLAGYQSSSDQAFDKVKQELSGHINLTNYPHQKFIYFVVFEGLDAFGQAGGVGGQFGPSGGMALIPRGVGATDAPNFNMATIAHELGHAFGLDHDFRSTGNFAPPTGQHYVMSYDSADAADYVLSDCNADYLAVDRYFNRQSVNGQPVEGTSPEIKVKMPLAYASGATSHQVEFELSDPDGLHQVQFSVVTDVPEGVDNPHEVANDSPQLEFCQLLYGVPTATTDHLYDTHLLAVSGSKSSIGFARRLHIKVVDVTGQESYKNFTIYDQGRSPETHTFTSGSLSELLKGAWPKDIISISGTPADTGDLFIENGLLTLTSTNPASPQPILARLIIDGAEGTRLDSLSLTGVSLQAFAANVVIDSCVIQSTGIAGVYIDGKSSATLTGNTIQNCSRWGVYAKTGSMVTVGGSTVQESNTVQSNDIGIQLEGVGTVNQPVLVTGNTIQDNGGDGIVASEGAVVTIGGVASGQANSIINNGGSGLSLYDKDTNAKIISNTIQGNKGTIGGVYIDGGQADIVGNIVQSNLNWGIYGRPGTQLTIGGATQAEGNTVQGNTIGIQLEGVGTVQQPASITGNVIQNNTGITGTIIEVNNIGTGISLSQGTVVTIGGSTNGQANSILNNAGIGITLLDASDAEIVGNTIQENAKGIRLQGAKATINGNQIEGNNDWGIYVHSAANSVSIDRNIITKNKGGLISFEGRYPLILRSNLITRCTGSGNEAAVWLQGAEGTLINNTIADNSGYGLVASVDRPLVVANTIFAQNQKSSLVNFQGDAAGRQITYSLFDGSGFPFGISEINNLNDDPQFVDAANDDYHLQSTSPAINAGDNTVSGLLSEDLDGNPRISNSTVDLGVYEYGSTALIRQLAFSSPVQSIDINQDSGKITVQLQDQTGSPVASVGDLAVALSSSSATGTISASVGGAAITSITISAGENQADFYYRDTVAGDVTLTVAVTIGSPTVEKSATQTLTVRQHQQIRELAFSSPVQSIDINQDSGKITVQLQDQTGSPVTSVGDLTVALSSSSATGTISASVAGVAITSITIAAGENQADFYYMDTVAGDVTLTATATIGSPAVEKSNTQTLTINDVDLIAPSISSTLAATLSPSDVKAHGITIQFSETMNPTSGNIKLVRSGETTRLNRSVEWDTDKRSATIELLPHITLIPGGDYTISLSGLVDTAGNELVSGDRNITFQATAAGQIAVSSPVQSGQRSISLHLQPVAGGGDLTSLTVYLADQMLIDTDRDGFDDFDASINAQYLTLKVFKESKETSDGLDVGDLQVGPVISATEDSAGNWGFQIDFASPGLAVTGSVNLYLELVIQADDPGTTTIIDGAEMGQQAEISLVLSDIQASVDILPALDQSGDPVGHNWFDAINPSKEEPILLSVALTEDQPITVDKTQLEVVTQLGTSTTKTFTLTNTTDSDRPFSVVEAAPAVRTISLSQIIDDSTDDTASQPIAIDSVEAELNTEDLELKILSAGTFTIADLLESAPPGESVALILLDTDRNNEGQLQPEDFGGFAGHSDVGVDYALEIQSMGANLVAELIDYTDGQGFDSVDQIPVKVVGNQAIELSVPRLGLSKTDQSPVYVLANLGDDYTDKGTVTPFLDTTILAPTVTSVEWLSVAPSSGSLAANSTQDIIVTISTDQVGFSEAELLIRDANSQTVASVTVTRAVSGIDLVRLSVSPDQALLKTGQTLQFAASGEDLTGVERNVTTGLHWSILGDTDVGSIDSSGLFTAGQQSGQVRAQVAIWDSNDRVKVRAASDEIEVIDAILGDSTGPNGQPDGTVDIFDLVNMASHWQETATDTTATSSEFAELDIAGGGAPQVISFDPALTGKFYDFSNDMPSADNLSAIENHVLDPPQMTPDYTGTFASIDFPKTGGSLTHQDGNDIGLSDHFLAQFTGLLKVGGPGTYQFHVSSDDGFRLAIEGQTVAVFNDPRGYDTTSASYIFGRAGEYAIDLGFFESGGNAGIKLEWTLPGQGDGQIDIFDLVVLADNFGRGLSTPLAAPSILADLSTEHQASSRLQALSSDHTLQVSDSIRAQTGQAFELQALLEGLDQIQAYSFDLVYDTTAVEVAQGSDQQPVFTDGTLLRSAEQTAHSIIKTVQQDQLSAVKVSSVLLGQASTDGSSQTDDQNHSLGQLRLLPKTVGQSQISIRNLVLISQNGETYTLPNASYMLQIHRQVDQTRLLQNYPNPFNPETWIPFELQSASPVNITIYDQRGQQVRELNVGYKVAGPHHSRQEAAYWDGRNRWGEPVSSGLYFYYLKTDGGVSVKKMTILK